MAIVEGMVEAATNEIGREWYKKYGPFITQATREKQCGQHRGGTCHRLKGHVGTQHATLGDYDSPPGRGRVVRIWFEQA